MHLAMHVGTDLVTKVGYPLLKLVSRTLDCMRLLVLTAHLRLTASRISVRLDLPIVKATYHQVTSRQGTILVL